MDKPLYCSFCGKSQDEVAKLIAGPTSFICDECVDLCKEIVNKERATPTDTDKLVAAEPPPPRLPEYVVVLQEAVRLAAQQAKDQERLADEADVQTRVYVQALLDIAFPDRSGFHPDDFAWASTRAYQALGGRMDGAIWLDTYEDLKGETDDT